MIRDMVVDNIFYPADPDELRPLLQRALHEMAGPPPSARVAVVPFGAFAFTLPHIMSGLRALHGSRPRCIFIIAPPTSYLGTVLAVPESDAFATPFGNLPVAVDAVSELRSRCGGICITDEIAHLRDSSVESLLPVIHYLWGAVPIVPVLVGDLDMDALRNVARVLDDICRRYQGAIAGAANLTGFVEPSEARERARKVMRLLLGSSGSEILPRLVTFEDAPRSLATIALAHTLAGQAARPELLGRGTFETDVDGATGRIVFASIAYIGNEEQPNGYGDSSGQSSPPHGSS